VVGQTNDSAYRYTASGVYTGESFYIGSQDGLPNGIVQVGTDLWVTGDSLNTVYKYQPQIGIVASDISASGKGHNYTRIK